MKFEIDDSIRRFNEAKNLLIDLSNQLAGTKKPIITQTFCKTKKEYQWRIQEVQNVGHVSILVSVFLHHMHSAIDNLAWQLSVKGSYPKEPVYIKQIYYRAFSSEEGFRKYVNDVLNKNMSTEAIKLIEETQPYHSQNPDAHPLSMLNVLSNIDKHRALHVISAASIDLGITLRTEVGDLPVTKCPITFAKGPLREGQIFAMLPWPFDFELAAGVDFVFDYVFDGNISPNIKSVQLSLVKILGFVDQEILQNRFKPFFEVS